MGDRYPEQASKGRRGIRRALLIAVAQVWIIVVVIAVFVAHLLLVALVLAVLYTAAMPVVLQLVKRDVDRRTIGGEDPARESFGRP